MEASSTLASTGWSSASTSMTIALHDPLRLAPDRPEWEHHEVPGCLTAGAADEEGGGGTEMVQG